MLQITDSQPAWPRREPKRGSFFTGLRRLFGRRAEPEAARSYRFLARQIAIDLPHSSCGAILLLSAAVPQAAGNEMLLLLAHALREELRSRVLLVDGTLCDEGVGGYLGRGGAPGLADWLADHEYSLAELIQPTAHSGIALLPAGVARSARADAFQPRTVPELYNELAGRFDHVLVQQKSILDDTRYLPFASQAGLVLLLIEEGVTMVGDVDRALEVFRDHQVGQVRLVLCEPS